MKAKVSRKKIIGASAGIVVVAAVAGYMFWGRQATAEEYLTAKIERGSIKNTVAATGALQAVTTVQVGSQVSGTISALFADFNSNVRKGQVVAQLDPAIFSAQVASARANLESARANLTDAQARVLAARSVVENQRAGVSSANANLAALRAQRDDAQNQLNRQESLAKSGIVPERDLETARTSFRSAEARYNQAVAQVEQARLSEQSSAGSGIAQADAQVKQAQAQVQQSSASLQLAEVNLSHATIKSPIDGVVVSRNVDVGQTVAASLSAPTLFTIANDLTQMQVIANIDQADIGVINQENRVNFTVDAFSGENFVGSIRQIRLNPQNVQNVVTYNVVIDVSNPNLKLKPGMTANLTMTIAERTNVLKISNSAFRFRPAGMTQEQIRDLVRGGGTTRDGKPTAEKPEGNATPTPSSTPVEKAGEKTAQKGDQRTAGVRPERTGSRPEKTEAKQEGERSRGQEAGGARGARSPGGEARPEASPSRVFAQVGTALAEGQRRVVWVLGPDNKPQPRRVRVGITDGTATELAEGEVKEGDVIIVGQNVSGENRAQGSATQRPPGFGGSQGGFGGGGRPGGGGGNTGGVRR